MTLVQTLMGALAAGEQVQLRPGDTLRVTVSFKYTVAEAVTVTLWGWLAIPPGRDIEAFKEISLEASLTPKTWEGYIDIPIPTSGKSNGTYKLGVEVNGTEETIPDAVVISGYMNIWDLIPSMLMVMMMGMIMPMMEEV